MDKRLHIVQSEIECLFFNHKEGHGAMYIVAEHSFDGERRMARTKKLRL